MQPPRIMGMPIIRNKINGILLPIIPQDQIIQITKVEQISEGKLTHPPSNSSPSTKLGLNLKV